MRGEYEFVCLHKRAFMCELCRKSRETGDA